MVPFNPSPTGRPKSPSMTAPTLSAAGGRSSNSPLAISIRCRATRSPARLSRARRSSSQSRTRSPTCASSTPCSARPRRACGRSRKRLLGLPRRPNTTSARIRRKPTKEKKAKSLSFAFFRFLLLFGIGTFQWVTAEKSKKNFLSFRLARVVVEHAFKQPRPPLARLARARMDIPLMRTYRHISDFVKRVGSTVASTRYVRFR